MKVDTLHSAATLSRCPLAANSFPNFFHAFLSLRHKSFNADKHLPGRTSERHHR